MGGLYFVKRELIDSASDYVLCGKAQLIFYEQVCTDCINIIFIKFFERGTGESFFKKIPPLSKP